ncbi:hypothetical protein I4U23_003520 [Adineta vaga]|nr:hypothetical protein I4U23_003520 [Adineta vaga]
MVRGHMHTSIWPINNNLLWCRLKAYLSNVTLICSLYSTTFQALHRCLRITYYTNAMLYRNIYLYSAGIIVQIFASMLQPLPLFLLNIYQYDDYHCQVQFTNWSGMIIAACLVWLLPVLLTVAIYVYTIHYIRRNSQQFTFRQRTRIKRDITIIRRIFWLIIFILIFGMPACSTTIVYYIFGYVEWWENHMIWLTFILSFMGISTVQTFYSPHLRTLWLKSSRRISLAICT